MTASSLHSLIRDVPDFPKPGIVFKDITPLLADAAAFQMAIDRMAEPIARASVAAIVAIESRGFIFGGALARQLSLPLILVRKPGKLPHVTEQIEYQLEYGTDRLEIHADAIQAAVRYSIVDDVLATGGTAAATAALVRKLGGEVSTFAFLIELGFLEGRVRLGNTPVESVLTY